MAQTTDGGAGQLLDAVAIACAQALKSSQGGQIEIIAPYKNGKIQWIEAVVRERKYLDAAHRLG